MFYTFTQNNSGGSFVTDDISGIGEYVIIEAKSAKQANEIAENKGIYFNGCDDGTDCSCCGDRWYPVDESDGNYTPLVYGEDAKTYISTWGLRGSLFIHYSNGVIQKVNISKQ